MVRSGELWLLVAAGGRKVVKERMFRGHSYRNLDPKGRLMLPPEFREEILRHSPEGRLVLTRFVDKCVCGYPLPAWEEVERSFTGINILEIKQRNLQRLLISGAMEVTLDKQGRILVPPYLRSYGGLDKDVILAGMVTKFEIWDQARFEERLQATEENFDKDMAELAAAGFQLHL